MLQLYADGAVAYDSRLEEYTLLGLKTTTGLNKGGTAEIILPPGHPAYNDFISYKTLVTLYENGALQFRGRALYPSDDFYNRRTVVCEGERCFLRDGVIRPYLFQDTPAAIFAAALDLYNESVDEFKRFSLGQITVTDPNDYVRLESESAETFAAFYDKLVERCGGYIVFTDTPDGGRAINWLAEIGTESNQAIEFGENLLEFARSGESAELATAILPYGAQLEDGTRVTIAGVNGGVDWIQDDEAVALRGRITATVTWDDVTDPANLLAKARQWLAEHKLAVTSLQLTAADLSRLDRSIDSFHNGDLVHVLSKPHGLDDRFQLTERTIDWLNPAGGNITLGRSLATLTGADVVFQMTVTKGASQAKASAVAAARLNTAQQIQLLETQFNSKIAQTSQDILLQVSNTYAPASELQTVVKNVTVFYYLSTSSTEPAGGSWSETAPEWVSGKYMWTKTVTVYGNGTQTESTPACISGAVGAAGVGVSGVAAEYYLSESKTEQTGGSWSTTAPEWEKGKYLWTRTVVTYTDGTTSTTEPVCDSAWEQVEASIKMLADSINLQVSGKLGGTANITLSVNGEDREVQTLDMSGVRKAFADDTTAVTIQAGTITFNSGTIIINSDNFQVTREGVVTAKAGTVGGWTLKNYKLYAGDGVDIKTVVMQAPTESNLYVFAAGGTSHDSYADCPFRVTKAGKLYATDAVVYGDIVTIDGSYKTQLERGSLSLYFDDVLCGTINTKYWSGASTEGVSLRVEEGGHYIMFSHADDTQGSGYVVDYYLNAGWSSNYDEMHIFQTSARFLDDVYFAGYTRIRSLRLFGSDGEYLVGIGSNGALTVSKL